MLLNNILITSHHWVVRFSVISRNKTFSSRIKLLTNATTISVRRRAFLGGRFFEISIWQLLAILQRIAIPRDAIVIECSIIRTHFARTAISLRMIDAGRSGAYFVSPFWSLRQQKFIFVPPETILTFWNSNHAPTVHYIIILIEAGYFVAAFWQILKRPCPCEGRAKFIYFSMTLHTGSKQRRNASCVSFFRTSATYNLISFQA